jgi:hypothetical protein
MTEPDASLYTEKIGRAKGFRKSIHQSLLYTLPDLLNDAYDTYSEFLSKAELNLSSTEIHVELMKEMAAELFTFFKSSQFKQDKILEYAQVVEDIIPAKLFSFLLWSQDKKDACIEVLQNYQINLSEKEYDSLYLILMPHRSNHNVPYKDDSRIEYLARQKTEFFSYQNKIQLANELTELPIHNSVSKKPKL